MLRNILRRLFGGKLRNKPGGMAWIRGLSGGGSEALNGRAVRTVRFDGRHWAIEPEQVFTATCDVVFGNGNFASRGERVLINAVADECLEPWKDLGDDGQDEALWELPKQDAPVQAPQEA